MHLILGAKIRELRRRDGRTQEALAEALGVTPQAVSRWEVGEGYPDMEIIPAIANYFGVTIDELFGYSNERPEKIDELVSRIREMNAANNGVDVNTDECIALAREALLEFPGNEKIMLELASVLYNAGYVRYGEYHLTDEDGYDVYDVQRHRTYAEWKEAITLYEKLLKTLEAGDQRRRATCELMQLYLNTGAHEKAMAAAEAAPGIHDAREFLRIRACDGRQRAQAYGEALLATVRACAELMIGGVLACEKTMSPAEKVQSIYGAIGLFDLVCTDGNCGRHHSYIAKMYMLLSLYLWLEDRRSEAFDALDKSLLQLRLYEASCRKEDAAYTAPLIRLVKMDKHETGDAHNGAALLAEDWPWWSVPEAETVRKEMQEDPRWNAWVLKMQE